MKIKFLTTIDNDGNVTTEQIDSNAHPKGVNLKMPSGEGNECIHVISPEFCAHYGAKYRAELRGTKEGIDAVSLMQKFESAIPANKKAAPKKAPRSKAKK